MWICILQSRRLHILITIVICFLVSFFFNFFFQINFINFSASKIFRRRKLKKKIEKLCVKCEDTDEEKKLVNLPRYRLP